MEVKSKGMPVNGVLGINQALFAASDITMRNDNLLVLLDMHRDARSEERQLASGLYIPRTAEQPKAASEAQWATVVRAGKACEVRDGDRVLVESALVGDQIIFDGIEHRICRESVVMAVGE